MMPEYELTVPGEPAPWTVYTRRGLPTSGFQRMRAWQEEIQVAVINKYGRPMLNCGVKLDVIFYRSLPKPWPKGEKAYHKRMREATGRRPDLSNYVKALEDSLTGILIQDDGLVTKITASKFVLAPGVEPETWFKITTVE